MVTCECVRYQEDLRASNAHHFASCLCQRASVSVHARMTIASACGGRSSSASTALNNLGSPRCRQVALCMDREHVLRSAKLISGC